MAIIHKEGYRIVLISAIILLLINVAALFEINGNTTVRIVLAVFSVLIFVFILRFFRKPAIVLKQNSNIVYAPADGVIVAVEEVFEAEYFKDKRIQVSVFMSVWNVHINWYPVSGKVKYVKYHPGKYLVARHPKSSSLNERTSIVISTSNDIDVLVRQIAGYVARRVIYYPKENQEVNSGEEMGFIRFGSRVDVFLPLGTKILAKPGQTVSGCISEIAVIS
jgi:phosphatidylserine decarboxylase